jgi:hypothetical protein
VYVDVQRSAEENFEGSSRELRRLTGMLLGHADINILAVARLLVRKVGLWCNPQTLPACQREQACISIWHGHGSKLHVINTQLYCLKGPTFVGLF